MGCGPPVDLGRSSNKTRPLLREVGWSDAKDRVTLELALGLAHAGRQGPIGGSSKLQDYPQDRQWFLKECFGTVMMDKAVQAVVFGG